MFCEFCKCRLESVSYICWVAGLSKYNAYVDKRWLCIYINCAVRGIAIKCMPIYWT